MIHAIMTLLSLKSCLACFQVLSVLKFEKGKFPEDYSKSFTEAVAVFQHAQMCVVCENQLLFE